jgi:hypothetical protein
MSNANKQVRDAFFDFKNFLVEQNLMNDIPADEKKIKRNASRATSKRKPLMKRTLSSMKTIQPIRKKGMSQSRRNILKSKTLIVDKDVKGRKRKTSTVKNKLPSRRLTQHSKTKKNHKKFDEVDDVVGFESSLQKIKIENSIYADKSKKDLEIRKKQSYITHQLKTEESVQEAQKKPVKSFNNISSFQIEKKINMDTSYLSGANIEINKLTTRPKARTIHQNNRSQLIKNNRKSKMKNSGSTKHLMISSNKGKLKRTASTRNIGVSNNMARRRATANEKSYNMNNSTIHPKRRGTYTSKGNSKIKNSKEEYLGELDLHLAEGTQNVYDSNQYSMTTRQRRNTGKNIRGASKHTRQKSKTSFMNQSRLRKNTSIRNINSTRKRSMSRGMSQNKNFYFEEISDDTPFDEIEFEHVKLNQLLDFVLRNFYKIESEITLNILLKNILDKFTKPKEIIRNSNLSNLIRRSSSSTTIPISKTTLTTLTPFWEQALLNLKQMLKSIETLFEILIRKVGPIEFFDFFVGLLLKPDIAHNNLLELLFEYIQKLSPLLLTHKQIIIILRYTLILKLTPQIIELFIQKN